MGKFTSPPVRGDAFSVPVSEFNADAQVGGLGVYEAIQAANEGFKALPSTIPHVFIATGNVLPFLSPRAGAATSQLQKKTSSYLIELATVSYANSGARYVFFFFRIDSPIVTLITPYGKVLLCISGWSERGAPSSWRVFRRPTRHRLLEPDSAEGARPLGCQVRLRAIPLEVDISADHIVPGRLDS